MKNNKKRLKEIDIIRTLAIVLIVVCHLHFYVNFGHYQSFLLYMSPIISFIGLSLFFFASGFSLYYNYDQISSVDLKNFYFKRVIRIFPLFWFAILITIIWHMFYDGYLVKANVTYFSFIISILGLQGFVTNYDQGFFGWFIGIILIYYFIYPIVIRSKNIINSFLIASIILSIFLLLRVTLNIVYMNFFMYYWSFILGIIICGLINNYNLNLKTQNFINNLNFKKWSFSTISIIIIPMILLLIDPAFQTAANFYSFNKYYSINAIKLLFYTLLIYFGARILVNYLSRNYNEFFQSKIYDLIKKISFATYAIFLFHGLILIILVAILDKLNLSVTYHNFFVITIGIPLSFVSGYYIQKSESKIRFKLRDYKLKKYLIESWNRYKNEVKIIK